MNMNESLKQFLPTPIELDYGARYVIGDTALYSEEQMQQFADTIIKQCIDSIETYRIPCGNSAAGEMACEWTYDALKEIRDEIKEKFGMTDE